MEYLLGVIAGFLLVFAGYCAGHCRAWAKWEMWMRDEKLSAKARNRIAGLEE